MDYLKTFVISVVCGTVGGTAAGAFVAWLLGIPLT
jgi:hypothetical protein